MSQFNSIALGARNLNISALNKNRINNEYVGNSDIREPLIHTSYRGRTNNIPVITNGQVLMSSMNEPSSYNRYLRLENSAFSYPTLKKWSESTDNLTINKLQESKLKETLVSKINNLIPKVEVLKETAILPDNKNTLESMKSILTSMAVNLLYNEERESDNDKIIEIEKWLKLYLAYLNGSNVPPPAYTVPAMFLKPVPVVPAVPVAPPISSLTPSTVAMLVKEIQKLIPKTSPAINLSRASISAIVKELGVELPDLLRGLEEVSSEGSVGSAEGDEGDEGIPFIESIPSPTRSVKSVKSVRVGRELGVKSEPVLGRSRSLSSGPIELHSKIEELKRTPKSKLRTLLKREPTMTDLLSERLKSKTPPKTPPVKLEEEKEIETPSKTPKTLKTPPTIKTASRETKSKNKDLPYGDEAKKIIDKATELGVVGLSGKIKGKYTKIVDESTKTEYEIVIPKSTDTYGELYSTNKIPIIITNKYLSQAGNRSNKEDFLNILQPITSQSGTKYSSESTIQNLSSSSFINPSILIDTVEGRNHFISDRLLV